MSTEVSSIDELKKAIESGATEIISYDDNIVKLAKSWGPMAVGGIITAIPVVLTTGPIGAGIISGLAPSAGVATSTIIALIVVIGGTIAISLFTDWEYVEIGKDGIKMKRKN